MRNTGPNMKPEYDFLMELMLRYYVSLVLHIFCNKTMSKKTYTSVNE